LHFFWVVRDEGSWLEIGSTISHFCIASLLCVFVAGLEGISEVFISGIEVEDSSPQLEKEKELGGLISDDKSTTTETTVVPEGSGASGGKKNSNGSSTKRLGSNGKKR